MCKDLILISTSRFERIVSETEYWEILKRLSPEDRETHLKVMVDPGIALELADAMEDCTARQLSKKIV